MIKRDSGRKKHNPLQPSRVLLVCIYDTIMVDVDNQLLYQNFAAHGKVEKVLVFEKGQVTKAFVQYAEIQGAEAAKTHLDGSKIYGTVCKMHLFYSSLKDVDLNNRMFSRGKDYSSCSSDLQPAKQFFLMDHNNIVYTRRKASDDFDLQTTRDHYSLQNLGRFSKTDEPSILESIQKMRLQDPENDDPSLSNIEQKIRSDIERLIIDDDEPVKLPTEPKAPEQTKVVQQDEQILANWILTFSYESKLRPLQVYNLFSNFGDINKIIVRKNHVVVEYITADYALMAYQALNNTVFYSNVLKIQFAAPSIMKEKQREYAQSITFDESFYRFTASKLSINMPSTVLHVSNIKKQACTVDYLKDLFSEAGFVEKVSILNRERNMALVKMGSLEQSFNAVGMLHGKTVQGRKMQISFTKSRI